jgi:23S rRNA (uracil1939-C5)-methyltransferase
MTEYTIKTLGVHGDGIADGPLFAPLTLPGEVVEGRADDDQLRDIKIVTPSSQRVAAPCRHFKSCGGCNLQHAHDDLVAEWKVNVVRQALKSRGLETDFRPIVTSRPHTRRRATFAAKRTKKGAMAGFFGRASDTIVEIPECHLLEPALMEGLDVARQLAVLGASRKAALAVTVTVSGEGLDVLVRGGKPLDGPFRQTLAQVCQQLGLARLTWEDDVIAMRAPPTQSFGTAAVVPPPGGFLQATKDGEAALVAAVREILDGADQVADLFAGCGTFALPLAEGAEVWAVEGDAEMMAALDKGWRQAQGLKLVKTETRDLFRRPVMPDELRKIDGVVVDPPRAGAEAQVAELAQSDVPRLAYVSCNPVTFARDAEILSQAGYHIKWIQVVDQFRWSSHIELAACLVRD